MIARDTNPCSRELAISYSRHSTSKVVLKSDLGWVRLILYGL